VKNFTVSSLFDYTPIVDRPPFRWPNGARVAVWVIPNIEHYHIESFQPDGPDIRNFSRTDYGNRVGIWRLMEVLNKHRIRGTVALNGEVCIHYPRIVEEALKLDWELMGHGMTNSQFLTKLPLEEEKAVIAATKKEIEGFNRPMKGWLGPGLRETWNTLDLLKEAGVQYVSDWVNDDLPIRMKNGLFTLPYSIEINDMPLFNNPSISVNDFHRRICDAFDVLYREGETCARVMAIAVHPHLIGVPHRISYLDRALGYIASHEDVWFATGSEIIDYYASVDKSAN
jgi:allantoinase